MLQQTQVKTVIPYWHRWMTELPTVEKLAKAKPLRIHKLWEGLGYYTRVRNMQKAARLIMDEHDGSFPTEFNQVLELPGIGRYTAGAVCSIAFNQPRPILDSNVIRVLTRVFAIDGNPKEKPVVNRLWDLAQRLVTEAGRLGAAAQRTASRANQGSRLLCSELNQSLMELGALVCTPRQPLCTACPLKSQCAARRLDRIEDFPRLAPRPAPTRRRFVAFVVEHQQKFLAQQRPGGVVNAHLWEFPNVEVALDDGDPLVACQKALGSATTSLEHWRTLHHSITRYRMQLDVYRAAPDTPLRPSSIQNSWFTKKALQRLPFTSAHKKVLQDL